MAATDASRLAYHNKKNCVDATQTRLTATDSLDLTDWTRMTRPVSPCSECWFKYLAPRELVGRGGDFPWAWHGVLVALSPSSRTGSRWTTCCSRCSPFLKKIKNTINTCVYVCVCVCACVCVCVCVCVSVSVSVSVPVPCV